MKLILIIFVVLSNSVYANISRKCNAYYKIELDNPSYIGKRWVPAGQFQGKGGCGRTVPNRCRRRARNRAHDCMREHWNRNNVNAIPSQCAGGSIVSYRASNLQEMIKAEACDFLRWTTNSYNPRTFVKITAVTRGDTDCKKDVVLANRFLVRCDRDYTGSHPMTIRNTREFRINVRNGSPAGDRYKKVTTKCAGSTCVRDISIFNSENRKNQNRIMEVYNHPNDNNYIGCGRKVAQNVLSFFGLRLSQSHIAPSIKAFHFKPFSENIAVFPSDLRKGLQRILDRRGFNIQVQRFKGKNQNDIVAHLRRGYPVLALVKGGAHWVVISGYKASRHHTHLKYGTFLTHNNWRTEVWSWNQFSLKFNSDARAVRNILLPNGTSYHEGTIITFRNR